MLCLIIKMQDKFYALAAADVEHIYPCPYIENKKLNYHGEMIPVIDLAIFLKLRRASVYGINTPFVIMKAEKKFGLLVEELVTVDSALELGVSKDPAFSAELLWQNKQCKLLNISELYARAEHD